MSRIGPYSTPTVLAKLDGRTREARLMQKVRDDLTGHLGGDLTAPQTALVERAAWLSLHVALMDEKMLEEGEGALSERDGRQYLAWVWPLRLWLPMAEETLVSWPRALHPPPM